jgi:DNA-binding transcriptional MerR regulator
VKTQTELAGATVAAVARRLGIAPATLRTWDRRYGLGPTEHNAGAHRRYSPQDIVRLTLMRRLVVSGMAPADAAAAALAHTGPLPEETRAVVTTNAEDAEIIAALHRAAEGLQREFFEVTIRAQISEHGVTQTWQNVIRPLLHQIGSAWESSGTGIEIEHMASEVIRRVLGDSVSELKKPKNERPVLLACVGQETHSLAIHALAAALAEAKIESAFLGAQTPQVALNEVVRRTAPPAIFLWAQLKKHADPAFIQELPKTRPAPRVIVGGPGWQKTDCGKAVVCSGLAQAVEEITQACGF